MKKFLDDIPYILRLFTPSYSLNGAQNTFHVQAGQAQLSALSSIL